jgi:radical SAM protein with 4Fe4S-binding SPASM domain
MDPVFPRIRTEVQDIIHFLKKLNAAKIMNFLKVFGGFYISRILRKPVMTGFPVAISIEPTTACNLRCPECISGLRNFTRPTGMMEIELFKKIISQFSRELISLNLYFQGEPFLNPLLPQMINLAHIQGIYTLTSTNGHYLSEECVNDIISSGLDRLIISVDSYNQETYARYRVGGNIETVKSGIDNLVRIRKSRKANNPFIILQFLVYQDNEKELQAIREMALQSGADKVVFKTMQINDYVKGSGFLPENEKFSRYKMNTDGGFVIKNKLLNHCWKMWHSCVLTWNGTIVPCCFDKDSKYQLGSALNAQNLKEIWMSKEYDKFRQGIFKHRSSIDICSNCTEGTKVWI